MSRGSVARRIRRMSAKKKAELRNVVRYLPMGYCQPCGVVHDPAHPSCPNTLGKRAQVRL
jgi:uncharacterized OB-fold protein